MFRKIALAAALSLATLPALAADLSGPYVVGSGENQEVVYPNGGPTNVIGGGLLSSRVQLNGTISETYGANPAPQQNLIPQVVGSGENASVIYVPRG